MDGELYIRCFKEITAVCGRWGVYFWSQKRGEDEKVVELKLYP